MSKKVLITVLIIIIIFLLSWLFYKPEVMSPIYVNASVDMIKVNNPSPGSTIGKSFTVTGEARGYWYFEASFPVLLKDKNGKVIASVPAQAQGEWMTENFVPFKADIKVPENFSGPATLVLKNDNPSGLPEKDASVSFPITVEY